MNVWFKYNILEGFCFNVLLILILGSQNLSAQTLVCNSDAGPYGKNAITQNVNVTTQSYREAPDYTGVPVKISIDIYQPVLNWSAEQLKQRPIIIMYHGGGLKQGSRKTGGLPEMAKYFAQRGYVAISADYRLGWENSKETVICGKGSESDYLDAQYRAMQDDAALIKYLKKQANSIQFDTNRVFVFGFSSGSILALSRADTLSIDLDGSRAARLGPIQEWNSQFTNSIAVAGIISIAGAQLSPNPQAVLPPTAFFHGTCDNSVVFEEGRVASCPNFGYYYGPEVIRNAWISQNSCYELHAFCGFGHDFLSEEDGKASNEGLNYILEQSAIFLKNILCNQCVSKEIIANDFITSTSVTACSRINSFDRCQRILPPTDNTIEIMPSVLFKDSRLVIKSYLTEGVSGIFRLYNSGGALVFEKSMTLPSIDFSVEVPIPALIPGTYIARYTSNKGQNVVQKIIQWPVNP